jgi:hypothetical protein
VILVTVVAIIIKFSITVPRYTCRFVGHRLATKVFIG